MLLPGKNEIYMPEGSKPISVVNSLENVEVYFEVPMYFDDSIHCHNIPKSRERFVIECLDTGKKYFLTDYDVFLGTVLIQGGLSELHCYWINGNGLRV
jgi:hypothetical protein